MFNFFKSKKLLLSYGITLAFLSSFGQTFVVSLYLPSIQETFGLSDSAFSSIYSGATILSAFSLTWFGRFIDKMNIIKFTTLVLLGLAVTLVGLSQSYAVFVLGLSLYGLRLFGQGLLSHTSVTAMARFFDEGRGKAISIASLGHPIGEILLPFVLVTTIYAVGWRFTLLLSAGLVALAIPFTWHLLRKNTSFSQLRNYVPVTFSATDKSQANPLNIIRSRPFWIIMPSIVVASSIGTGFLLFKLKMGLSLGWSPTFVALGFSAYAIGNALSNIAGGILADKYSGKQLFVFYLLPAMVGMLALTVSTSEWVYLVLISGIGISNGFGSVIKNVSLAEIYGVKIIGSVRSLFITIMVFSTALGTLLFGFLLDYNFSFPQIALIGFSVYLLSSLNSLRILRLKTAH